MAASGARRHSRRHAMTMVELLVVVLILGIVATLLTLGTRSAITQSREQALVGDLQAVQLAADKYRLDSGSLPAACHSGTGSLVLLDLAALQPYLQQMPQGAKQLPGAPQYARYFVIDGRGKLSLLADETAPFGSVDIAGGIDPVFAPTVDLQLCAAQLQGGVILRHGDGSLDLTGMQYRLRSDPNFTASDSYEPLPSDGIVSGWTLDPVDGEQSVYVQFKDQWGNESAVFSDTVSFSTLPAGFASDVTPPAPPADLDGTAVSATRVDLSWTAAVDDVAVASYRIYRSVDEQTWVLAGTVSGAQTVTSVTGLTGGTTYFFYVTACDGMNNESAPSNTVRLTPGSEDPGGEDPGGGDPTDTQPPTRPLDVKANALQHNRVSLTWTAATDNVGVTLYEVQRSSNNVTFSALGTTANLSYLDTTVTGGRTYYYRVIALDAAGNRSDPSSTASAATPVAPSGSLLITAVTGDVITTASTYPVQADVSDPVGVDSVYLYYRPFGSEEFMPLLMVRLPGTTATYQTSVPVGNETVEYYIEATSASGVMTSPEDAPVSLYRIARGWTTLLVDGFTDTSQLAAAKVLLQETFTDSAGIGSATALLQNGRVQLAPAALPSACATGTVPGWDDAVTYAAAYSSADQEYWTIPYATSGGSVVHRYNAVGTLVGTLSLPEPKASGLWVDPDGSFFTVHEGSGHVYHWGADGSMDWRVTVSDAAAIAGDDQYLYLPLVGSETIRRIGKDGSVGYSSFSAPQLASAGSERRGAVIIGDALYLGAGGNTLYRYGLDGAYRGTVSIPVAAGAVLHEPHTNRLFVRAAAADADWQTLTLCDAYPTTAQKVETVPVPTASIVREVILRQESSTPDGTSVTYAVSADAGAHWQAILPDTLTVLDHPGDRVTVRATLQTADATLTPVLNSLSVQDTTNATSAYFNDARDEITLQLHGTWHDALNRVVSTKVPLTGTVTEVLLTVIQQVELPLTTITYEVSLDAGATWTAVVPGEVTAVPSGSAVILRATLQTDDPARTPRLRYYRLDGR